MTGLTAGGTCYSHGDALAIAVGYAFGSEALVFTHPDGGVGPAPEAPTIPKWAYRTYDCIAPHPGRELEGVDLLIADGLNGRMLASNIGAIASVAPDVSAALTLIPLDLRFWDLTEPEVTAAPAEGERAWPIWRAWTVLMGSPGVALALTHKTLHHKRPDVFPLIDNQTVPHVGPSNAWAFVHRELSSDDESWAELERDFADEARRHSGVPLTRLRLHDVLVWTEVTGNQGQAKAAGTALLTPG